MPYIKFLWKNLNKTMDIRNEHIESHRVSRKRKIASGEMIFFDVISGSKEGVQGMEISFNYGLSLGTSSNYCRQVLFAINRSFLTEFKNLIP